MVSLANMALGALILAIFAVSLLNPGGFFVALFLALIILGFVLLVPFVQDYVLSVNKGKAARKTPGSDNRDNRK